MPIANIAKIMKRGIPEPGKIAKDARECVQECVSEFISFITSEASDRCHMEKRKTINGEDILFAMTTLGFDNYVEPLKLYLQKYREVCISKATICLQNLFTLCFNILALSDRHMQISDLKLLRAGNLLFLTGKYEVFVFSIFIIHKSFLSCHHLHPS